MKAFFKRTLADKTVVIALLLLVGCAFLSTVIPPLKSPDEHVHIWRAYLLGKGVFIQEQPEKMSSGGQIDTGLLRYAASYPPLGDKVFGEQINSASKIRWSEQRSFVQSAGTAYYFPLIYLPQTTGLFVGKWLGLTVDYSYKLSRAFALLSAVLLIFFAFRVYPTNPLTLALIAMPMSLFQFSSASLDGVSTAMAILAIATFLRIAKDKKAAPNWSHYILAITIVLLVTSRIHALPMIFLLAASFLYSKNKRALYLFAISSVFIAVWTVIAIKTTVDLRHVLSTRQASNSEVIVYYIKQPIQFFSVLWETLSDRNLRGHYRTSFLGVLGWLDAPFGKGIYTFLGIIVSIIAALTVSFRHFKAEWPHRLLLLAISLISVLFIFFALLITWSPHPANKIDGVQGRYFLIPMILLAYGVAGSIDLLDGWRRKIATTLCLIFFVFSVVATTNLLLKRYYMVPVIPKIKKIVYPTDRKETKLVPSEPLSEKTPISLNMPFIEKKDFGNLERIGILIGTHVRNNPGKAEVLLKTKKGETFRQEFSLPDLEDNAYKYFDVPSGHYVSGEIRFLSGGGISVWESHSSDGQILSCMDFQYTSNKLVSISGCPHHLR